MRKVDFLIDGDPDPLDLVFPSPDGFAQDLITFDRKNGWNADIAGAAAELLPEVSDPSVVGSLVRLIETLAPQAAPRNRRKSVPARHKAWKPLHEVSVDVLNGLGLRYRQGQAHAPGYLVNTWRVWEDLLTVGARLGFGSADILSQKGFALGARTRIAPNAQTSALSVFPDCVVESNGTRPRMLLDAKYKGHVERGALQIAEADIYEGLAFSRATDCNLVVLAYPALRGDVLQPVGTCTSFEFIEIDELRIVGVQIESRLISRPGARMSLSKRLAEQLPRILA